MLQVDKKKIQGLFQCFKGPIYTMSEIYCKWLVINKAQIHFLLLLQWIVQHPKNDGNRCEAILINEWYLRYQQHVHLHWSTYLQTFTVLRAYLLLRINDLYQFITKIVDLSLQLNIILFSCLLTAFDCAINVSLWPCLAFSSSLSAAANSDSLSGSSFFYFSIAQPYKKTAVLFLCSNSFF